MLNPLQHFFITGQNEYISLLFLPHGVRILSAWMLGWKSIPMMTLAAFFTQWLLFGVSGFSTLGIISTMSGVVCCTLSFWFLTGCGMDFGINNSKVANWKDVFCAGSVASVLSSIITGAAYRHNVDTVIKHFIGDITGMFTCMFALMLFFRYLRKNEIRKSV